MTMLTKEELSRRAAALLAHGITPISRPASPIKVQNTPPVEAKRTLPIEQKSVTPVINTAAPAIASKPKQLQALFDEAIFRCSFVPSKNGGFMAGLRIGGRVVFPQRGVDVRNDGTIWRFQLVGENPKHTVYFARLLEPASGQDASPQPVTFVKDPKGKIMAVGVVKSIKCPSSASECTLIRREGRSRSVKVYKAAITGRKYRNYSPFAKDSLGIAGCFDDECNGHNDCRLVGEPCESCGINDEECTCCEVCRFERKDCDCDNENPWNLRNHIVNCHACGFEDCRCDGTSSDWVPARTTLSRQ
ncbi:MAG: hypothetical protein P4L53_23460 [Candidatus Obscuribacterales bacterium]|nr:hypothetical protein [Candidatus Obscuribacterales bacterium]